MQEQIDAKLIEEKLNYRFNDRSLLLTAFTHSSYANAKQLLYNNERLEHLGDAVVGLVVTNYLYNKFTSKQEGSLSDMRDAIVSGDGLAKATEKLGLMSYLLTADKQTAIASEKLPSSLFEAVVGAIYIDGGIEKATRFVVFHLKEYLDSADKLVTNPKSMLQEWCQQNKIAIEYPYIGKSGHDNDPVHTCSLIVGGKYVGTASAKSKQKAEILLAKTALEKINNGEL